MLKKISSFFLPWALCGKINAQHAPDRICRFFMPRDPQPTDQLYRLQHLFTWDAFWRNLRLLRSTKYSQRFEHEIFFEIENFNESKKPSPLCETCQLFRTNQFQLTREITHEKSCRPSAGIYVIPYSQQRQRSWKLQVIDVTYTNVFGHFERLI